MADDGSFFDLAKSIVSGVFPPRQPPPGPTFWHADGKLWWRAGGRPIELQPRTAREMREAYQHEAGVHYHEGEIRIARRAAKLWRELTDALDALGPNPPEAA